MFRKAGYTTTYSERFSFWFFGIGMLFYYQIVGGYLNTYLLLQGVDLGKIALIFLGIKIWDAVNDPLFAFIFDRVKFKKEKCLPWLRVSAVIMPLASLAVFNMPGSWSETGKLIWFAVTYMLWDAAYTVCDVPFFSMTTTMSANMDERNTLFSVARVFHGAGTLICSTIMTWLVGENCGMSFGLSALIVCGVGVLFTLPLCFLGKERCVIEENEKEEKKEEKKFTLREMFTYLRHNKYLTLMYGCQILCGICATGGAAGMVGTYYLYGQTSFGIITTWLNMIPGPVLGLLLPYILKKVDRFKLYMACNLFTFAWGIVGIFAYFCGFLNVTWAITTSIVTAIPATLSGLVAYMFTLDALEYGRYKTGIDATGINFAVQTFSAKIPGAFSTALGTFLLSLTSFVLVEAESIADLAASGVVQTQQAITEMFLVTTLPGMISSAIAYVLLLCFYKLRSKDVEIMTKCNRGEITKEEAEAQLSREY
ncbi:MAG: MFS transporter [Clostridia bacterium]|nr:MFS transporter [Clostridia bacterium]